MKKKKLPEYTDTEDVNIGWDKDRCYFSKYMDFEWLIDAEPLAGIARTTLKNFLKNSEEASEDTKKHLRCIFSKAVENLFEAKRAEFQKNYWLNVYDDIMDDENRGKINFEDEDHDNVWGELRGESLSLANADAKADKSFYQECLMDIDKIKRVSEFGEERDFDDVYSGECLNYARRGFQFLIDFIEKFNARDCATCEEFNESYNGGFANLCEDYAENDDYDEEDDDYDDDYRTFVGAGEYPDFYVDFWNLRANLDKNTINEIVEYFFSRKKIKELYSMFKGCDSCAPGDFPIITIESVFAKNFEEHIKYPFYTGVLRKIDNLLKDLISIRFRRKNTKYGPKLDYLEYYGLEIQARLYRYYMLSLCEKIRENLFEIFFIETQFKFELKIAEEELIFERRPERPRHMSEFVFHKGIPVERGLADNYISGLINRTRDAIQCLEEGRKFWETLDVIDEKDIILLLEEGRKFWEILDSWKEKDVREEDEDDFDEDEDDFDEDEFICTEAAYIANLWKHNTDLVEKFEEITSSLENVNDTYEGCNGWWSCSSIINKNLVFAFKPWD